MTSTNSQITELLAAWNEGEEGVRERIVEAIYPDLRRLAAFHLAQWRGPASFEATELAHEVYFKLLDQTRIVWQNRAQLLAVLSRLMRRLLVDEARHRSRRRRGGGQEMLALDDVTVSVEDKSIDLLALDRALTELARIDELAVRVIEALFFGGFTHDEAAAALGVGRATVSRRWRFARAWLRQKLCP